MARAEVSPGRQLGPVHWQLQSPCHSFGRLYLLLLLLGTLARPPHLPLASTRSSFKKHAGRLQQQVLFPGSLVHAALDIIYLPSGQGPLCPSVPLLVWPWASAWRGVEGADGIQAGVCWESRVMATREPLPLFHGPGRAPPWPSEPLPIYNENGGHRCIPPHPVFYTH